MPPGQGFPRTLARTAAAGPPAFLAVPQENAAADMGPTAVEQARQSGGSGVPTPTNGVDTVGPAVFLGCLSLGHLLFSETGCTIDVCQCTMEEGCPFEHTGMPFPLRVSAVPVGQELQRILSVEDLRNVASGLLLASCQQMRHACRHHATVCATRNALLLCMEGHVCVTLLGRCVCANMQTKSYLSNAHLWSTVQVEQCCFAAINRLWCHF